MNAEAIVAIVLGMLGVCGTLIGCTWAISGKMSGLETAVKTNIAKTNETHLMVSSHSKECDIHRVQLDTTLQQHGDKLDEHGKRISGLETC